MKIKTDKADILFSKYIKERDKNTCQRCKKPYPDKSQGIHNSHFWGRGNECTRYDPINCDALCFGCHQHFHSNPKEYNDWKLKQLGEKEFKALDVRAHQCCRKDRKLSYLIVKKLYDELQRNI